MFNGPLVFSLCSVTDRTSVNCCSFASNSTSRGSVARRSRRLMVPIFAATSWKSFVAASICSAHVQGCFSSKHTATMQATSEKAQARVEFTWDKNRLVIYTEFWKNHWRGTITSGCICWACSRFGFKGKSRICECGKGEAMRISSLPSPNRTPHALHLRRFAVNGAAPGLPFSS